MKLVVLAFLYCGEFVKNLNDKLLICFLHTEFSLLGLPYSLLAMWFDDDCCCVQCLPSSAQFVSKLQICTLLTLNLLLVPWSKS